MRFLDPSTVKTKEDLRLFTIQQLPRWISQLNRDKVRLHLPRREGLMRLIPEMHFHLNPEIFLQISGSTTFRFPEETCRVGPGEMCLVSRGLPHGEKACPRKGPFYNLVFQYATDHVLFHLARQNANGRPIVVVSMELENLHCAHLVDLLKHPADWNQQGDAPYRFAVKGSLLANLSIVLATLKEEPSGTPEPLKVMQVRQLIIEHLSDPRLSVAWIGHSLQSSPDYLSRLFRKTMGQSIAAHISERRTSLARNLLVSSTLNISEISRATGYEDPSYFTRVFRKETGVAPRQYRHQALKQSESAFRRRPALT